MRTTHGIADVWRLHIAINSELTLFINCACRKSLALAPVDGQSGRLMFLVLIYLRVLAQLFETVCKYQNSHKSV